MKKLLSMLLVLVMLLTLLPMSVLAEGDGGAIDPPPGPCPGGGAHTLTLVTVQAFDPCVGGFESDYYLCSVCQGTFSDAEGAAPASCKAATHTLTQQTATYDANNPCAGGFESDYYLCSACQGTFSDAAGAAPILPKAAGHVMTKHEALYSADNPCAGGYKEVCWECSQCMLKFADEAGTTAFEAANYVAPKAHTQGAAYTSNTPVCEGYYYMAAYFCGNEGCTKVLTESLSESSLQIADHAAGEAYTDTTKLCEEHYEGTVYYCQYGCGTIVDSAGKKADKVPGVHILRNAMINAGCEGYPVGSGMCGYDCGTMVDKDGKPVTKGEVVHTPDMDNPVKPYYVPCAGGYDTTYYNCMYCLAACDADGKVVTEKAPTAHNLSAVYPADYSECMGGFKTEYYQCRDCYRDFDKDGKELIPELPKPDAKHTPDLSKKYPADYTECGGGYTEDYYLCSACGWETNAEGNTPKGDMGKKGHTVGQKYEPNYTECGGGIKTAYYRCSVCNRPIDENGNEIPEAPPASGVKHKIVKVEAKAPTYTEEGWKEYYICEVCKSEFRNAEGDYFTNYKEYMSIWLDKLPVPVVTPTPAPQTKVVTEDAIVPPSGMTEAQVQTDMEKAAMAAGKGLTEGKAGHKLIEVTLQVKTNGKWKDVDPDKFPKEGVTVLLPYPEGTSRSTHFFVVTHMLSHGDKAGQVEVMKTRLLPKGIEVTFKSMSPVMISYQEKAETPQTGDQNQPVMWGQILVVSMAALTVTAYTLKKRKEN